MVLKISYRARILYRRIPTYKIYFGEFYLYFVKLNNLLFISEKEII